MLDSDVSSLWNKTRRSNHFALMDKQIGQTTVEQNGHGQVS